MGCRSPKALHQDESTSPNPQDQPDRCAERWAGAPTRVGEGKLAGRSQRWPAEIGARPYVMGDGADKRDPHCLALLRGLRRWRCPGEGESLQPTSPS